MVRGKCCVGAWGPKEPQDTAHFWFSPPWSQDQDGNKHQGGREKGASLGLKSREGRGLPPTVSSLPIPGRSGSFPQNFMNT